MTKRLKQLFTFFLLLLVIVGGTGILSLGSLLKANASSTSLVDLTINGEAWSDGTFETEEESVIIALTAKERSLLELSYDEELQIVPLGENEQENAYPEFGQADFDKEQLIQHFNGSADAGAEESSDYNSSLLSVTENEQKGVFYLSMEKGEIQRFRVTQIGAETKEVIVRSAQDNNLVQKLFQFGITKQDIIQDELPYLDTLPEVNPESEQPAGNNVIKQGSADSLTDPFGVTIGVNRTTGLAPFDVKEDSHGDGKGYDYSGEDNIVRTFDQVSYNVNIGISNTDKRYNSLRVRLDTELPDAWRIDTSGQVRQTAELANGTVTDTGNGTKKSSRSVWTILGSESGSGGVSGQVYFTETMETFGGVNGDKLKPEFTVTIESATTTDGETEVINQIIDSSIKPELNDTVYITAKPLVDAHLSWTPARMSTFEKATGDPSKPHSLITNVGVYVELKPLPGREDLTSIKGSTYPLGGIKYKLDQHMFYSNEVTGDTGIPLIIGKDNPPLQVITYDGLPGWNMDNRRQFTAEYEGIKDIYQPIIRQGLGAPVGYTNRTYPPNQDYSTTIGIYNTGNPKVRNLPAESDYSIEIENTDYTPASVGRNKWLLSGDPMSANAKPFSVTAMQVLFPYDYLEQMDVERGSINYRLTISEIEYEDTTQEVEGSIDMIWKNNWPGEIATHAVALNSKREGINTNPIDRKNYTSAGDSITAKGNSIWGSFYTTFVDIQAAATILYGRWNANSMSYDETRNIIFNITGGNLQNAYYGVGPKVPDSTLKTQEAIDKEYTWYSTVEEALDNGEVSAIKTNYRITDPSGQARPRFFVPLKAVGPVGAVDKDGEANVLLTNAFNYASDGETLTKHYPLTDRPAYSPTTYDKYGEITNTHNPTSSWGDTLYIGNMTIRPTIEAEKSSYAPDEHIKWTVHGSVESDYEDNLKVTFKVTIPKETQYVDGTAKDHEGKSLSDPTRTPNEDGSWTLTWTLDYRKPDLYNPKVTFDTSIVSSQLNFENNVANLSAKVVVEVCTESDPNNHDDSSEEFRTSTGVITVTNSGTLIVDKTVDQPYIDNGKTEFTYKVAFRNHSPAPMKNVRILDVLPYNGDGRGTQYNGKYSLTKAAQLNEAINGSIWYTAESVDVAIDPNDIVLGDGNWHLLDKNMSDLKEAKAVMLVYDSLPKGEDMSLALTLEAQGQRPGDIYVNSPSLNSNLNSYVNGVPRSVRVVGRDFSGVAWYDDDYDGLMNDQSDKVGSEDFAADIPVKLYRTSLVDPNIKNQLMEESLTGEKFVIDGESQVKTDENGKYTFTCLPEGEYVAEFIIDGQKYRVTKQLVGDDSTKNSKANADCKTSNYNLPVCNDCGPLWKLADPVTSTHHTTDVNIGLIRFGTINLFKYEAGTAVDENKDGKLDDSEKANGKPLKGAVFELYEGHDGTGNRLGEATTDENGKLQFGELNLGEYSLVETTAPDGFELLKKPVNVTITGDNQVVQLYQDNDRQTELPFTGGNNPTMTVLLIAASLLAIGFIGMTFYYRQPNQRGKL